MGNNGFSLSWVLFLFLVVTASSCCSFPNGISEVVEEMGRAESYPSFCNRKRVRLLKAGLCLGWAGPLANRAQSGYCLFGKSYGILLQLFMEENIWCFWKRLGVGGCRREGRDSPLVPSIPEPVGCRGQCYVTPCIRVFRAEKFETSPALVPGMGEGMALVGPRRIWGSLFWVWAFPSSLTSGCFPCTFARTLPLLWLKSGPAMLILN